MIYQFYMGFSMYISYDYYRVFYYVAKYKNISQASKILLSNQPNVTRTIKLLENALGCKLFVRSSHGVSLTYEGKRLFEHVEIAFEHLESGEEEIALDKTLQRGIVSIGATEIALHCLLLPVLQQFKKLYPNVKINITNQSTPQATNAVKNGLLDFALVTTPNSYGGNLKEKIIKDIKEVAVCSSAYKELLHDTVTIEQLSTYPIISLGPETMTNKRFASFFNEKGYAFNPTIEAATTDQIILMLKADMGVSFIPEEMIKQGDGIHRIKLSEELPLRHICLIEHKDHTLSIAAKKMEEMIFQSLTNKN